MLTPQQRAFLEERNYAVVATLNADGSIQQTVIWFILEGDQIRFSAGASAVKIKNLQRTPTISLTIEGGPRYLTLSGTAQVEPADQELRRRLAQRYLDPERVETWLQQRPDAARVTVRMTINKAYGQGV